MNGGCDAAQWVGQHLRPVQISMSGRFRFVLLRVSDTAGRHRYFVRGHSKATPAELLEEAIQEVGGWRGRLACSLRQLRLAGDL